MEEGGEEKGGWDGSVTYHRVVDLPICIYLFGKKKKKAGSVVVKYIAWRVSQHVVVMCTCRIYATQQGIEMMLKRESRIMHTITFDENYLVLIRPYH